MEGRLQKVFGQNVRALRESWRMSQEHLAEYLGCHRTYLGAIERGERNVTLQTVERLSKDLGVDPAEMLREGAVSAVIRSGRSRGPKRSRRP